MSNTTSSRIARIAAVAAAGACLALPATSAASDGDAKPMSVAQSYRLTCGHLGLSCARPHRAHRRAHRSRRRH
jgi:hypothetical protein